MVYPISVHKQAQKAGKVTQSDMMRFGTTLFIMLSVGLFFLLQWILKVYLGASMWLALLITLLIAAIIGSVLLRYFVFDEPTRVQEYENQSNDSFAKYVFTRKDIVNPIDVHGEECQCFEFTDGSQVCVLQFRYGSNDDTKAAETLRQLEKCFAVLGEENMPFRTISMREDFSDSVECDNIIRHCNSIEDKKLARHLLSVANNVLTEVQRQGNVITLYLMICPKANYHLADLEAVLRKVFAVLQSSPNAFRSIECLNQQQLLKLYKDFYGLETIDLSTMRVLELSNDTKESFGKVVSLYKMQTESGKTLVNKNAILGNFRTNTRECK